MDDALENELSSSKRQSLKPIHFSDPFVDLQTNAELPLVYLHGTVKSPEKGYVFSRDQYLRMIKGENPWMVVLSGIVRNDPLIISGSSMDEVDLEYYLSFRSKATSREDVGPSIFVDTSTDRLSESLCRDHNLIQFVGYSSDFMRYLSEKIPNPPLVEERIDAGIRDLLPSSVSHTASLQLDADFELVPNFDVSKVSSNKFYYGHPPRWRDLSANLDISRREAARAINEVNGIAGGRRIIAMLGPTGVGKTTALKRTAYNLASRGKYHVLWASEIGRLSRSTASTIDLIEGPIILMVDNLADHAQSISDVLGLAERDDIIIIGAERSYRKNYLDKMLGSGGYEEIRFRALNLHEIDSLIDKMTERMLVGSNKVLSGSKSFIRSLQGDPIAVATCRVLNDFRPLSRIVRGLVDASTEDELIVFAMVGVSEYCFKGGVRRAILARFCKSSAIQNMLDRRSGLALRYVDRNKEFLATENSTLTDQILIYLIEQKPNLVKEAFINLSFGLAPFVNRKTIRARTPDARLAGRLFDFDDIVEKFLGGEAEEFYDKSREVWRWNSRFWEQAALLMLEKWRREPESSRGKEYLEESLQRARYSVAIEEHPFGLTTLGTVLMSVAESMAATGSHAFSEGVEVLLKAIALEQKNGRTTQHPYSAAIRGAIGYLSNGGAVSVTQKHDLSALAQHASSRWSSDKDIKDPAERLLRIV